ncbi:MAG: calcium-binding protein [Solirubrobacteraceae bacterium]|nr:calcium-binding protein [Solirubrobacteraceae bacterium]
MSRFTRPALILAAVVATGAAAAPAHAMQVGSGPEGLRMQETNNTLNRVQLSLIDVAGVTKYRVEMPEFGGRGLNAGLGCVSADERQGVNVVICERTTPQVKASLGPMDDSFSVVPSFPDPIEIFGGIGADTITLGAGNDTLLPSTGGGGVQGNGGDDTLNGGSEGGRILGGEGNDQLSADQGTSIDGGPGDDILTLAGDGVQDVIGGDGTDTFTGPGSARFVDSRDGIAEQVFCGRFARNFESRFSLRFSRAFVDLVDTPDDFGLRQAGCARIDRAPANEKQSVEITSSKIRVADRKAAVSLKCVTNKACTGRVWVSVGKKRGTVAYRIAGKTTKRVSVPTAGRGKTASVTVSEQGVKGKRTIRAQIATA